MWTHDVVLLPTWVDPKRRRLSLGCVIWDSQRWAAPKRGWIPKGITAPALAYAAGCDKDRLTAPRCQAFKTAKAPYIDHARHAAFRRLPVSHFVTDLQVRPSYGFCVPAHLQTIFLAPPTANSTNSCPALHSFASFQSRSPLHPS